MPDNQEPAADAPEVRSASAADLDRLAIIWGRSWDQLAAAQILLSAGDDHYMEAARLLCQGWHALACALALERGEPYPEPSEVGERFDETALAVSPGAAKDQPSWRASFEVLSQLCEADPWFEGDRWSGDKKQRQKAQKAIRSQAALLEQALRQIHCRLKLRQPGGGAGRSLYKRLRWIIQPVLILLACFLFYSFLKPPDGDGRAGPRPRSPTMLAAGPRAVIRLEELADAKPSGYNWDGPGTIPIINQLQILLRKPRHPRTMEVSVDCNDVYTFEFHDASGPIKSITLGPLEIEAGLNIYRGTLPGSVTRAGVIKVVVKPKWGDDKYSIGHLLLKE